MDPGGNDTIDRYPPAYREIEKILCVKEVVFKKIQKDFKRFLKANKAPKVKPVKKLKIRPIKVTIPQSHFEASEALDTINNVFNHRKGRMKEWHSQYGQGMYE